jgi:hypothetical protein
MVHVLFRRFVSHKRLLGPIELLSPRVKQRILSMRHRALETRVGGPISSILRSYGPVLPMQLIARIGMRRAERRGRNREEEIMMVRHFRLAALVVFLMRSVSSTAAAGSTISLRGQHAAVARQFVSDNDSMGVGATISTAPVPRPAERQERTLSIFLVNYKTWQSGPGINRADHVWGEPALSHSIATANASMPQAAQALFQAEFGGYAIDAIASERMKQQWREEW